ncbi:uncharacterized protein LOC103727798 isoform X2 [Nannospalax galili]|uniref:uncharacterized protein LOC103727798 isoform X2 n=1 Tax=Nannospalax galili TaxID=1026970 RepID=UPI00111C11C6|nr:uncharacterized protein LOC103727798 isoform X2 [Nannospalax galili]
MRPAADRRTRKPARRHMRTACCLTAAGTPPRLRAGAEGEAATQGSWRFFSSPSHSHSHRSHSHRNGSSCGGSSRPQGSSIHSSHHSSHSSRSCSICRWCSCCSRHSHHSRHSHRSHRSHHNPWCQ